MDAALRGFWRGRNTADNEAMKNAQRTASQNNQAAKNRARYKGSDD